MSITFWRRCSLLILSIYLIPDISAQTKPLNVVTSAVPFLRISPDARAGGMGDAGIATIPDANAIFWNQAKVPFARSSSAIGLTYTPWLKSLGLNDVYLMSLAGYKQVDEVQAISGSIRYFSLGNIDFVDANGNPIVSQKPKELGIDFGYSRKLSGRWGLGLAIRYINSNLVGNASIEGSDFKAGNAVAGDISFFYDGTDMLDHSGFNFGAALTNLGAKISYTNDASEKDYIPANFGLGAAYISLLPDNISKITFALDVNKLLVPTPPGPDNPDAINNYRDKGVVSSWFSSLSDAPGGFKEELREFTISTGAEYSYNDQFLFRAGYFYESPQKGDRKYFTLGAGINYSKFGLNFSYLVPHGSGINRNPLSNTLRFSLLFNLDPDINFGKDNRW